ncbi:MAG: thioredoxin family protein [Candidatus Hodarchaeales archaeon]
MPICPKCGGYYVSPPCPTCAKQAEAEAGIEDAAPIETSQVEIVLDETFFKTGKSFQQILELDYQRMDEYKSNYEKVQLKADEIEFFKKRFEHDIRVLAIVSPGCDDCIQYIPVIAKIASITDRIKLRLFLSSDYPQLLKKYSIAEGDERVPVVLFFSSNWQEYGRWIERPLETYELLISIKEALMEDAEVYKEFARMRIEQVDRLLSAAATEMIAILKKINAILVLKDLFASRSSFGEMGENY